jgi:hypothetical protein
MMQGLDVEVEMELIGMRTEGDGIHLVLFLVIDPGFDEVFREDAALEQIVMILLKGIQNFAEGAGG